MLKIRLMRIGAKKKPFYRVVAVDERAKRTGGYIELLGTYNPLTEPKEIRLKQDRIDHWVKQGAQLSTGFLRIIGKAPQRLPRKPKKEKKTEAPATEVKEQEPAAAIEQEEVKTEEPVTEPVKEEIAEPTTTTDESATEETANEPVETTNDTEEPKEKATEEEKKDE